MRKTIWFLTLVALGTMTILLYLHFRPANQPGTTTKSQGSVPWACPSGSPLCGVLTIESGLGGGNYGGGKPGLHGLWPQIPPYGNSKCVKPKDMTYDDMASCLYLNKPGACDNWLNGGKGPGFCFSRHEWVTHGKCAGGPGPASIYFAEACNLATPIIDQLAPYTGDWNGMRNAVETGELSKYLVDVDTTYKQFEFSVCSDGSGKWKLCELGSK